MKLGRIIIVLFFILFVSISLVYAGGKVESGSNIDGRAYFLAKNTVNNKHKAMKLNVESTYSANNASSVGLVDNWDASKPDQGMFRLIDTLYSNNQPGTLYMKISSNNNWLFINEDNASYTRPFGVNAFKYTNSFGGWNLYVISDEGYGGFGNATLVNNSSSNSDFYLFEIPVGEKASSTRPSTFVVPSILTDMDFCVTLPAYNGSLPDGYYYTDIHYEITDSSGNPIQYYEHTANGTSITAVGPVSLSGDFRLWGYVGENQNDNSTTYVFNISETSLTYNVDLKQSSYYNVAGIQFSLDKMVESKNDPTVNADYTRYMVYISPGESYKSTTYTAQDYSFKKLDTENQQNRIDANTVYYEVFKDDSGNQFPEFADHPYVYQVQPAYDKVMIADYSESGSGGTTMRRWRQTWRIEQPVYLRVTDTSRVADHLKGFYTTKLYFTLVVQ